MNKFSSKILSSESELKTILNHVNADVYVVNIIKLNAVNVIDKSGCSFHN